MRFRNVWDITSPAANVMHKQSLWDRPGILRDQTRVESSLVTCEHQASFRAVAASHSGDWLHALPITSCSLRMDDESVRVAVVCGWGATFAFHMGAFVALRLMPVARMPSFANGRLAESPETRL